MEWFSSNKLINEYGLSCIENYLLLCLSQKVRGWELLFCRSYLCFDRVLECIYNGQEYSSFGGIERLHKVAEEYGIIRIDRKICDFSYLEEVKVPLIAIRVNSEYMLSKYKKILWRDDHYIFIKKENEKFYLFVNDNPKDSGLISKEEVKEIFAGRIISYNILCKNILDLEQKYINETYKNVMKSNQNIWYTEEKLKKFDLMRIRDAIGITKVIVKRMERLVSQWGDVRELSSYYEYLCESYVKIEYYRIRKKNVGDIQNIVVNIRDKDDICRNVIIEILQKYAKEE